MIFWFGVMDFFVKFVEDSVVVCVVVKVEKFIWFGIKYDGFYVCVCLGDWKIEDNIMDEVD